MAKAKSSKSTSSKSKSSPRQPSRGSSSYRIFDDVIGLASTVFDSRKSLGGDKLQSLAEATRDYASSMTDLPTLQRQVNLASENMGIFAEYVLNTDIQHMLSDAAVLARRRPVLILVAAAAAGLAATRMVGVAPLTSKPVARKSRSAKSRKSNGTTTRSMNGSDHANA